MNNIKNKKALGINSSFAHNAFLSFSLQDSRKIASEFAQIIKKGDVIYLTGDLAAGKTFFVSVIIQQIYQNEKMVIKSPTFTLIEEYSDKSICHIDLYRINNPKELLYMGIEQYFNPRYIILVEWPEQGEGYIALPAYTIEICYLDYSVENSRKIVIRKNG